MFVVVGSRRIGRTSLLLQLPSFLPDAYATVLVGLREEHPRRLDWLLWRIAEGIAQQAGSLTDQELPEPVWSAFEGNPGRFLDEFWPHARRCLGDRSLVLMMDDLDSLAADEPDLLASLVENLIAWRDQDPGLAVVVTLAPSQYEPLTRDHPRLFGGAQTYVLGPLSSEEAMRLITWPVDGVLVYDYGTPRRLVEVTSGQPHYLQLLCFEIFERCAPAAWVNQRDLDLVLEEFVGREVPEFRQLWQDSTPQEQAVLAALASLRGARGVATVREVQDALSRTGARVGGSELEAAFERLADREVVERLGALSYRFRVALLRDWLGRRLDLQQVARSTRWTGAGHGKVAGASPVARLETGRERAGRLRRRGATSAEASSTAASDVVSGAAEVVSGRRRWHWLTSVAVAVLLLSMGLALWHPWAVGGPATPTVRAPLTVPVAAETTVILPTLARPSVPPRPQATALATYTSAPPPTLRPTPTSPLILARTLPSIAYLSRPHSAWRWTLYLMNSDGTNRVPVIEASSDFVSAPAWSPDGTHLAYVSDAAGNSDIWVVDTAGRNPVNLTHDEAKDNSPAWSPGGDWIAFASVRESPYWELYVMRADGSDLRRLTWWEDASDLWPSWSPDGTRLAFASKRDGNWEIYTMQRDGADLKRLTDNPADDTHPAWSPDGFLIAFESYRDGYAEIYVVPDSGGEPVNLTRLGWATDLGPTWSPDGGRIAFYSDRDGSFGVYAMAADGTNAVKLTGDSTQDQLPAWRP